MTMLWLALFHHHAVIVVTVPPLAHKVFNPHLSLPTLSSWRGRQGRSLQLVMTWILQIWRGLWRGSARKTSTCWQTHMLQWWIWPSSYRLPRETGAGRSWSFLNISIRRETSGSRGSMMPRARAHRLEVTPMSLVVVVHLYLISHLHSICHRISCHGILSNLLIQHPDEYNKKVPHEGEIERPWSLYDWEIKLF